MKKILGLDIGTNSIGWAVVNEEESGRLVSIEKLGSRIIPMSQDVMDKFGQGQTQSSTAERTAYRGVRRIRERSLLRRERLHRVLHCLHFLPPHYDQAIGWNKEENKTYGKFLPGLEVKLAWKPTDDGHQFIFYPSYLEMLEELKVEQPQLFKTSKTPVPLDWTIYYLRKKALTQPIAKEELAWILLNFNQKRGYYQLRGEESEQSDTKREEYYELKVERVDLDKESNPSRPWYNVHLENGWIYRRQSNTPLDNWVGLKKEFIVTTTLNKDGTERLNAEGEVMRSFKAPKEEDWGLVKKKTETDLEKSNKTVGAYIYDTLLAEPSQKIRGGLIKTIERAYYKSELEQILRAQTQFIKELQSKELFELCATELYPLNDSHRENLLQRDFNHLFIKDIIFYQRPLKTKKSLISNCPYEYRTFYKEGERQISPIKCIAKSNPLFQEFRLWQFINNLKILKRTETTADNKVLYDVEVTDKFLPNEESKAELFTWLNDRKGIKQDQLLRLYFKLKRDKGAKEYNYRWNYVEDREYPCNETRSLLLSTLAKCKSEAQLKSPQFTHSLWHLLYSVEDRVELKGALEKFAERHALPSSFVEECIKTPPFDKEYGAYSEKAIKRFLPLMRMGKYWSKEAIDSKTEQRINRMIDGEVDDSITMRAREKLDHLRSIDQYRALPVWLIGYIVYNRHSESGEVMKWNTPAELQHYIENEFKQHSLRNPIVEQVVLETLRTIKDLWTTHGNFKEIHVELGRDVKNSANVRKSISESQQENENRRQRMLNLLINIKEELNLAEINPYSPSQQEKLQIVEDGILRSGIDLPKDIEKIAQSANPTAKELTKYRLWLDQKYVSPYTGKIIPLSKLFTTEYQIEHIIPQSKYYDNSFSNKVICESEVNGAKGSLLGHEFILQWGGSTVSTPRGEVRILQQQEYVALVNRIYGKSNRVKAVKLLAEDIEEVSKEFSQRQLTDTRYISKVVQRLLSNLLRQEGEQESTSKHLISCSGQVTNALKRDWGLNDVWNSLVQPRFERLNELTNSNDFGVWLNSNYFQTRMPFELQKGFTKKRIDHRHHALDALIIACTTRSHINYISNRSATDSKWGTSRFDLRAKLCNKVYTDGDNYSYQFNKPWDTFTEEAKEELKRIVVSFKQNTRVLTKSNNRTEFINSDGKKEWQTQTKGDHLAIRKPLHQETIYGQVSVRTQKEVTLKKALENWKLIVDKTFKEAIKALITLYGEFDANTIHAYFKDRDYKFKGIDVKRVEVYEYNHDCAAVRKPLTDSLTRKQIESITDHSIQKILFAHLDNYKGELKEAFSPEGLAAMNDNIKELNGGKHHHPIYRARFYEALGSKFALGTTNNNASKYAVAAKGTNLFFGVYENEKGVRSFDTIPLNIVIDRLKEKLSPVPLKLGKAELKFYLSPNDLVYLPTEQEQKNPQLVDIDNLSDLQIERIYKAVSFSSNRAWFIPANVAVSIVNKREFTSMNKVENLDNKRSIKQICWKLSVNRLGKIMAMKK